MIAADVAEQDRKSMTINFTVIDCVDPGFSKVPYKKSGEKTIVDYKTAKPLVEPVKDEEVSS